jgi:hypothetical protein
MRYLREPLWALMLIFISTVLVTAAPQQDSNKLAKPAEANNGKIAFNQAGQLIVDPAKVDLSGITGLLLDVRLTEGRASIDNNGKVVIKSQYPFDCLLVTQILLSGNPMLLSIEKPSEQPGQVEEKAPTSE